MFEKSRVGLGVSLPGKGVAGPFTIGHVNVLLGLAPVVHDPLSHGAALTPLVLLHALFHRGAKMGNFHASANSPKGTQHITVKLVQRQQQRHHTHRSYSSHSQPSELYPREYREKICPNHVQMVVLIVPLEKCLLNGLHVNVNTMIFNR